METSTGPKRTVKELLQKLFNNTCDQPFKYWLYQQSPTWFRINVMWRYNDIKYNVVSWIKDRFCWHRDWVDGFVRGKDSSGIWIGWSDDDTFIPSSKKKWIKLFNELQPGDEFRCHLWWSILDDKLLRIKDVELRFRPYHKNNQMDLKWLFQDEEKENNQNHEGKSLQH